MKFNIALYQLDIFNIPSWVSFEHFYTSFHKYLSGMPNILRKNISKFVFENSWFQIADAIQSLVCDGRSVVVVNKSRTCWATIVISSLFLWNQQATGNSLMFILLRWYCHRGFGCGKMITFTFQHFRWRVHTRRDHLTLSTWCKCTDRCES